MKEIKEGIKIILNKNCIFSEGDLTSIDNKRVGEIIFKDCKPPNNYLCRMLDNEEMIYTDKIDGVIRFDEYNRLSEKVTEYFDRINRTINSIIKSGDVIKIQLYKNNEDKLGEVVGIFSTSYGPNLFLSNSYFTSCIGLAKGRAEQIYNYSEITTIYRLDPIEDINLINLIKDDNISP